MLSKKGWYFLLLDLAFAVVEFFLIFNKAISVGCLLVFFQNLAIPIIATPFLIENKTFSIHQIPQLEWMFVSAIVGLIPTMSMSMASLISYYVNGDMEKLDALTGIFIPRNNEMLFVDIVSTIVVVLCLTTLSAFSGLFAKYWFQVPSKNKL